jgi:predicted phosphodiesterase
MKMLIVSDIHGNWPALQAVLNAEPDSDEILCLGDLVNYGPQPVECVRWAMENLGSEWSVQGNHDRAVGRNEDPHCSGPYQALAAATQVVSARLLSEEMKQFLAGLEPLQRFQLGEAVFMACHAVPSEPLYRYLSSSSPIPLWESEVRVAGYPDFLLLGHSHEPLQTRVRKTLVVNPGSVGQPKHGDPQAAYALWEDGRVTLRRAAYDVERTLRAYDGLGLDRHTVEVLAEILRTGGHMPLDQTAEELWQTFYRAHPDKLETMFYLQKLLNKRIGVDTDKLTEAERQQWLLNYCRAMDQALAELTDCAPWKWWTSYQKFDKQNARVAIADLLHFLVSLAQVMEITPDELFDLYTKKHRLNLARLESGYTVKDETGHQHI